MSDKKDQLDRIEQRLDNLDVTMARNTVLLDEHIKRTNLLEEEMRPVKMHVQTINIISKIGSAVLAILLAAKQLDLF